MNLIFVISDIFYLKQNKVLLLKSIELCKDNVDTFCRRFTRSDVFHKQFLQYIRRTSYHALRMSVKYFWDDVISSIVGRV
jgi:hypothetical protein